MYFNTGVFNGEIGDFDVVEHEGRLHVFYLALPSHDYVGHLVSDDGLNWTPLPWAIRTGDPGSFDDDQIWTMGVFRKGDTWFMLYTANQQQGRMQVTGLATSKDLVHWTKPAQNPVAEPDARWYERDLGGWFRTDWRDPHIIERGGKLHAFLCARRNTGPLNYRGCAGYFTSTDGYRWEVQPPACTPNNCFDYECPSVFELGGRYYMVAIHGAHERMTYRVADRVEGPYRRPFDDSLTPGLNMSVRPVTWKGRVHLMHWNRGPRDWGGRSSTFVVLSSPKLAEVDAQGNLTCQSFDWSPMHGGAAQAITAATPSAPPLGQWQWQGDRLVGCSEFGAAHWLTQQEHEDFELTAEVELEHPQAVAELGFLIRADETGDRSVSARCVPGRCAAELVKLIHNRINGPDSLWRGRSVVQRYHLPPSTDGRYRLRLIAFGPNLEFNVNGRLVLSMLTMPQRRGRVGLIVEDGRATFSRIRLTPLQAPRTLWER